MFCRNCGKEIKEGAAFCGYCGNPVRKAENVPAKEKGEQGKVLPILVIMCCIVIVGIAAVLFVLHKTDGEVAELTVEKVSESETEEKTSVPETTEETSEQETSEQETSAENAAAEEAFESKSESGDSEEPIQIELRDDTDEIGVHTYELIVEDITWTEAYNNCLARGGYLVRINSDEEYQVILQQIANEGKDNILFWLGGARNSAASDEYRWVYEDGVYGNKVLNEDEYISYWLEGEPSYVDESSANTEMYMNMFYVSSKERWVWNDVPENIIAVLETYAGRVGYICEYEN